MLGGHEGSARESSASIATEVRRRGTRERNLTLTDTRLIEAAFPLRQVSLDSVHEKNVRHGHISTLHIWPARRPLAASRATLLAALLRDPGSADGRRELLRRIAGRVEEVLGRDGDRRKETLGGILHWGRESEAEGAEEIERFRAEIREAFGGRAPQVLDPFAGGGAIPLEAMRLGCEAVAADLNPVAWFILRCTLHYPRLLAGKGWPLPGFALLEREFVEAFLKARGVTGKVALREELDRLGHGDGEAAQMTAPELERDSPVATADVAWHLRAWGRRVLAEARRELAARYPTYAEFEPVRRKGRRESATPAVRYRRRPARRLEPDEGGRVSTNTLNAKFDSLYLEHDANPRWVAKPAVAYLWARTVRCGGCRAEIPLLKTCWLCRKANKRVRLTLKPRADGGGVDFGIERDVAAGDGTAAQRRETRPGARSRHDERERRAVSRVRGDRDDEGHPRGGAGRAARCPHDGGRRRWAGRQGIPAADRRGGGRRARGAERVGSVVRRDSVRTARGINRRGAAVAQLARGIRSAALRLRNVADDLHGPAAPGARHVRPGNPTLLGGNARLSRRLARGRGRLSRSLDQSACRQRQHGSNLDRWPGTSQPRIRPLFRPAHGLGFCRVLPSGRHHRRVHPGRRVDRPSRRACGSRRGRRARPLRGAEVGHRGAHGPLRPRVHGSSLLRRHPLLGPDGLLPRVAAAHVARAVAGDGRRIRRAARAEVERRRERWRAGRSAGAVRYGRRAVPAGVRGRHALYVPALP